MSALLVGFAIVASAAIPARAQEPLPLLSVEVDLQAYGMAAASDVLRGRVSIAYPPEGPRLGVYWLRDTPPPPRRPVDAEPDPPPASEPGVPVPTDRALWVWNTAELLRDGSERTAFMDFVERRGITRVFLYLASAVGARPSAGYIPFDSAELGPFLAELRGRGALAYALDGDRDYVLAENHAGVYRTVEALVEHNRRVPPEQRFWGVRYDIEPYLAPGFQGPARQALLDGYVELIAGVAERARAGGLRVAVDIPFWFDAPDEETGAYLEATRDGVRRRLIEHVMAVVDDVAIMDYRTRAEGPNGALVHARGEMELGAREGVDVFVGLETTRLVDEDLHTFVGPALAGVPRRGDARWIVLEGMGGSRIRVWLVEGDEALADLRRRTAGAPTLSHWPAGRPARVAADMQSFHNLGPEAMERVVSEVTDAFADRPAFAGIAYHDYLGLRALLQGR